jgi:hypothetical protein
MVKVVTFHMPVTAAAILPVRCPLSATDKDAPFRYEVQQVATGRQNLAARQDYTTHQGMSWFVSHWH